MQAAGAVGEVAGWVYDSNGRYLDLGTNRRVGGVRVDAGRDQPGHRDCGRAVQGAAPITAALKSRILNGLVTDEASARAILAHP